MFSYQNSIKTEGKVYANMLNRKYLRNVALAGIAQWTERGLKTKG